MAKTSRKSLDLALQGGGSHGAITWGVLDRILSDERLYLEAVSGTSAGAMNAVVLADGLHRGGRDEARQALEAFWRAVSEAGQFSPLKPTLWDRLFGRFTLDTSPGYLFFENLTQLFTPRQLNPFGINPLRDLLERMINFECVNAADTVRVFVTATNVRTGRAQVFRQPHLSVDTIMASACLPFMYEAVRINGEAYWDGGYSGNPALYPLVDHQRCQDLLVVQINPMERKELPETARDIVNRVNEVTFNSSLIKELRSIQLLRQLIEAENLEAERYRAMRLHLIHTDLEVQDLKASSKLNTDWDYLIRLRDCGWQWADEWLEEHFDAIGNRSTFDLDELFEDSFRPVASRRGKAHKHPH